MALVKIKNFPNRTYAERAKQTLDHEGIICIIQSADSGILGAGGSAGLPQGADIYVAEEDAPQAREVLESLFDGI